jgi:translation initiation factor 2 subunit 1
MGKDTVENPDLKASEEAIPEIGELVVASVTTITHYGVYIRLEDYPFDGFLHISQVSSRWVRNIKDILRPKQKIVVKVLRINKENKSVDVSLKDVSPADRKRVMREWKKGLRGEQLLKELSKVVNKSLEEMEEKLTPVLERYPNIYDALERILTDPEERNKTLFNEEEIKDILEFLERRLKPKRYEYEIQVDVSFKGKGGILKVRKVLERIKTAAEKEGLETKITAVGAPTYMVKVASFKPELLKRHAEKIVQERLKEAEKEGAKASLKKVERMEA